MKAWSWIAVSVGLGLAACGDSRDGAHRDAHTEHDDAAEFEGCPESIPEFALGMRVESEDGSIEAVLREASPAPPERFFNDWTLGLTDGDGAPLDDVRLRRARAYMPVHGHYGLPDPRIVQHDTEPSVFDLKQLNLFMRGPWEVTLEVSSPDRGEVPLVFHVCVEE